MIERLTFEFSTEPENCVNDFIVHVDRMFDPLMKDLSRKSYNATRNWVLERPSRKSPNK